MIPARRRVGKIWLDTLWACVLGAAFYHLEGQGDLINRSIYILGITRVMICVIGFMDLLTKSR